MTYSKEYRIAKEAVVQACLLAENRSLEIDSFQKVDLSPVTVVDLNLQILINLSLSHSFPGDGIMGEEDASFLHKDRNVTKTIQKSFPHLSEEQIIEALELGCHEGGSRGRFWTIDPIDGTKGFLRGDQYAVAVALIENGEVVVGAIGCPRLVVEGKKGVIFSAVRGEGAHFHFLDDAVEKSIPKVALGKNHLIYAEPHGSSKTHSHATALEIAKKLHPHPQALQIDSQCKYPLVAMHLASIYFRISKGERVEKIWDHAAGSLILEEAGGFVSDLWGKKLNFGVGRTLSQNRGILATSGIDHGKVVEASIEVLTRGPPLH